MPRAEKSLRLVRPEVATPEPRKFTEFELQLARERGIRLAAEGLFKAAQSLVAIPHYPEMADYRASYAERFEAAVKIMREALHE